MPLIKLTQPTNEAVMTIQRYKPKMAGSKTNPRAVMDTDEHGVYVSHASHALEMEAAQREIERLKSMVKSDFSYHLKPIFEKVFEAAFEKAFKEVVAMATQTVYTVNPCDKLTAERVREIMDAQIGAGVISLAEVEERGFATGGFVTQAEPGIVGGGFMQIPITRKDPEALLCIKSDAKSFKAGESYQCEANKDGALFVTQDEFVSDLNEDDYWNVTDGGEYYIVETIAGNAYFKK